MSEQIIDRNQIRTSNCRMCHQEFTINEMDYNRLGYANLPLVCPTCNDLRQNRPSVSIARQELYVATVVNRVALDWGQFVGQRAGGNNAHARPAWRARLSGERYGAEWNGRIDVWCTSQEPPRTDEVCVFKHMRTETIIAERLWSRQTMHHGEVSGYRQVPLHEAFAGLDLRKLAGEMVCDVKSMLDTLPIQEGYRWRVEEREYLVLFPTRQEEPEQQLVYVYAHSKETLKGFGRQYSARLSGDPLFKWECRGGARNGRFETVAWLAVVDPYHRVEHHHREGRNEIVTYIPDTSEEMPDEYDNMREPRGSGIKYDESYEDETARMADEIELIDDLEP